MWKSPIFVEYKKENFTKWVTVFISALASKGFRFADKDGKEMSILEQKTLDFVKFEPQELYHSKMHLLYRRKRLELVSSRTPKATPDNVTWLMHVSNYF